MPGGINSVPQINLFGIGAWDEDTEEHYRVFGKSQAVRTVLVNWQDRNALINAFGGFAGFNIQSQYQYFLPVPYPNAPTLLYYNGCDTQGVGVRSVDGLGMVGYQWCRMRILYESLPWNPNLSGQLQIDYGVEDIILPPPANATLGPDGSLQINGSSLWKFATTGNNVNAQQIPSRKLITCSLNSMTFNLLSIPFATLQAYAGAVNSTTFLGASEGQVMFMGAKSTRRPNFANIESYDLTKPFIYNSIGWQNIYNPQTGLFEKIIDQNGNPVFPEMNLNNIYP